MKYKFTKTIDTEAGMPFDIQAVELHPDELWPEMITAISEPTVVSIHVVKIHEDERPAGVADLEDLANG